MQPGRGPNWNVVASLAPDAWLEAVEIASDDRLPLPAALRKRVSWCAPQATLPLLASIEADGGVLVAPLSERRDELAAVGRALEAPGPADGVPSAIVAMAIYSQVSLQPDGRLRLSAPVSRHLGAAGGCRVWVAAHRDVIRLWSEAAWRAALSAPSTALRAAVAASRGKG